MSLFCKNKFANFSIDYAFTGTNCAIDPKYQHQENLKSLLQSNQIFTKEIIFLNQIHSNKIALINQVSSVSTLINEPFSGDCLITNLKNIAIAVATADCVPILLFDENVPIIAAIHAGWSGAFSNIIKNAVEIMKKNNASIKNIKAIIGPAIQQESYEVGKEFYNNFCQLNQENSKFFIAKQLQNKANKESKFFFDLPNFVINQLKECQINNINFNKIDSFTNLNFHSFRRKNQENKMEHNIAIKSFCDKDESNRKKTFIDCNRNIAVIQISTF